MDEKLLAIYDAILDGNVVGAKDGVQIALMANLQPENILADGMIAAMREVGRRFEEGDYYVPEMLVAACAMQAALSLLKPRTHSERCQIRWQGCDRYGQRRSA